MANCSVPPFLGCCAVASVAAPPSAIAAAPVIRTERRVISEFILVLPACSVSRRPPNAHSYFVASDLVAAAYGSEHRHFPLAFFACNRTACMEDAAARRG